MDALTRPIIVGVLGQWASGKTAAARVLIDHLGGASVVTFLTDREIFASMAVNYLLELEPSQLKVSIEEDGRRRFDGEHATVWLKPGEELASVDLGKLRFDVSDITMPLWHHRVRVELGRQIRHRAVAGQPMVIEAAFGRDVTSLGGSPFRLTIADLFARLEEAGVELQQIRWIIVEATYETRVERNRRRPAKVPIQIFDRFATDGGNLDSDHQAQLEARGVTIKRVPNDHDDIGNFHAGIIAAFEALFRDIVPATGRP